MPEILNFLQVILHDNKEQLLEQVSEDILPTYLHGTQDPESCEDKEIILEILGQDDFFNGMKAWQTVAIFTFYEIRRIFFFYRYDESKISQLLITPLL